MKKNLYGKIGVCFLLIILVVIAYLPIRGLDFVNLDDDDYITNNDVVKNGLTFQGIIWAFKTFHSANWHPLTWISHMLDCQIYGINPIGHHLTNILIHILNCLLLFFVFFQFTGMLWQGAVIATLFAIHPMHVESVAWVSERKDVLSTFFGLLMIIAYKRYAYNPNIKKYLLVLLLLFFGLMAKPMLVTFPFLLLLLDIWPLKRVSLGNKKLDQQQAITKQLRLTKDLFLEKIPLFLLAFISGILTLFAQQSKGAIYPLEILSIKLRATNAFISYMKYLIKLIFPYNLTVFYPHPVNSFPVWQATISILLVVFLTFLSIHLIRSSPYFLVGWFWYLITLIPVIGLIQVGEQAMADRYTYIPSIGIFMILSWGITSFLAGLRCKNIIMFIVSITVICALVTLTYKQVGYWKNGITLYEHAIDVTNLEIVPKNASSRLYYNLGRAYYDVNNNKKAIENYRNALKYNPENTGAINNLANLLYENGKPEDAILLYKRLLIINPRDKDARSNLANVLVRKGELGEAITNYTKALEIDPKFVDAHYNYGLLLEKQNKLKEAIVHFSKAIQFDPNYYQAYSEIGVILLRQGKLSKAKIFFEKALQIKSDYKPALNALRIINPE